MTAIIGACASGAHMTYWFALTLSAPAKTIEERRRLHMHAWPLLVPKSKLGELDADRAHERAQYDAYHAPQQDFRPGLWIVPAAHLVHTKAPAKGVAAAQGSDGAAAALNVQQVA